ncbi:MAG: helix-hairpin-helix domain-containing protein [Candidatus Aenigmatarchaeota archaeon]
MDTDRVLGVLIVIVVIVAGVLYFGSFVSPWWNLLAAVQVIVSVAFVVLLGIGGWIGWTMASTPSPEPVEDLDMEEIEEEAPEFGETEEEIEIPKKVEEKAQESRELREELNSIKGMTDSGRENLIDAGYDSVESLEAASIEDLKKVEGIGSTLAGRIKEKYR